MDIVETVSVLAGSIVMLGMFLSIAYEGIRTKNISKQRKVLALNYKWQKLMVSAH